MDISSEYLLQTVKRALDEDIGSGDLTTLATVDHRRHARGVITAKQDGILSGLDAAALVFYYLDRNSQLNSDLVEGSLISRGDKIAAIEGELGALLTGERIALNFLMHLSGIATLTAEFVKQVSHTDCQILDTRKTTPGLRLLEKRAVASGGGKNHRIGLFDMILIKENHIASVGSLKQAVKQALEFAREEKIKIEVETCSLADVKEAVKLPVDQVMLDNFTPEAAAEAVDYIRKHAPQIEIEASGNMTSDTVRDYADTGVDYISAGALTHSAVWLDLSMSIEPL